jgi:hypothetical protein
VFTEYNAEAYMLEVHTYKTLWARSIILNRLANYLITSAVDVAAFFSSASYYLPNLLSSQ